MGYTLDVDVVCCRLLVLLCSTTRLFFLFLVVLTVKYSALYHNHEIEKNILFQLLKCIRTTFREIDIHYVMSGNMKVICV